MSQQAYKALYDDLVVGQQTANDLQRRLREVEAKQDRLTRGGGPAQPEPDAEKEHAALEDERITLLAELQWLLKRPRLGREQKQLFRAQLTPAESAKLRQDMLQQIQAAPSDMKDFVKAGLVKVMQAVRQKHGPTPEAEDVCGEVKGLLDEI